MNPTALPVTFAVIGLSLLLAMSTAHAQGQADEGRTDKIKAMLLRPAGWSGYWSRPGDSGISEFVFEVRGEKMVAKIQNLTIPTNCERDVAVAADVVKLDGCYDTGITLRFDPNDPDFPFKGKSASQYEYKLKAK